MKKCPVTRVLSLCKYLFLVVFVVLIPVGYALKDMPLPAFCKFICPAGTLEGGLILLSNAANASYLSMLGPLFNWKFLLTVSILVGCMFIFRLFCRFICPLGAFYGLFNRLSFFGIQVETHKCTDCGLCTSRCLMDIKRPGDRECISCGDCVDTCPTKAIVWKRPGIFPKTKTSRITKSICAILMVAIFIGAIGYTWVNSGTGNSIEMGFSAQLSVIDKTGLTGRTIDPTKTGMLTIVNFWGTWCAPCIEELPYFDQIASMYPDNVQVIAVHTDIGSDAAPEFIKKYYPNSNIIFAKDYKQNGAEGYYTALGGRDAYPYTVVLDNTGIIFAKFVGSVSYQDLLKIVEENL